MQREKKLYPGQRILGVTRITISITCQVKPSNQILNVSFLPTSLVGIMVCLKKKRFFPFPRTMFSIVEMRFEKEKKSHCLQTTMKQKNICVVKLQRYAVIS